MIVELLMIIKICGLISLLLLVSLLPLPLLYYDRLKFTWINDHVIVVHHFIAHSDVFPNFFNHSCKTLEKPEIMLLSVKSYKLAVLNQRHR